MFEFLAANTNPSIPLPTNWAGWGALGLIAYLVLTYAFPNFSLKSLAGTVQGFGGGSDTEIVKKRLLELRKECPGADEADLYASGEQGLEVAQVKDTYLKQLLKENIDLRTKLATPEQSTSA